jgi:hypothetical protein
MKCIICGKDAVKLIGNEIRRDMRAGGKPFQDFPYSEYLAFCCKHDYKDYIKKQDKKGDNY